MSSSLFSEELIAQKHPTDEDTVFIRWLFQVKTTAMQRNFAQNMRATGFFVSVELPLSLLKLRGISCLHPQV